MQIKIAGPGLPISISALIGLAEQQLTPGSETRTGFVVKAPFQPSGRSRQPHPSVDVLIAPPPRMDADTSKWAEPPFPKHVNRCFGSLDTMTAWVPLYRDHCRAIASCAFRSI